MWDLLAPVFASPHVRPFSQLERLLDICHPMLCSKRKPMSLSNPHHHHHHHHHEYQQHECYSHVYSETRSIPC